MIYALHNIKRIANLQNKAIWIIIFPHYQEHGIYYKGSNILKINDIVKWNNFLPAHDHFHNNLPVTFNNLFSYTKNIHSRDTRGSKQQQISLPKVNINDYGINSIKYQAIKTWI